jgi:hypothetical protein
MPRMFDSLASGLGCRETKAAERFGPTWSALIGQQNSRAGVSVSFAIEQAADYMLTYRVTDLGGRTTS